MKITEQHIKAANLLVQGKLTYKKIAKEVEVTERTICNWIKDPDFIKLCDEIVEKYKKVAIWISGRWSAEAIKKLRLNLKQDPETARKSAMNILEISGLKPKEIEMCLPKNITVTIIEKKLDSKKIDD